MTVIAKSTAQAPPQPRPRDTSVTIEGRRDSIQKDLRKALRELPTRAQVRVTVEVIGEAEGWQADGLIGQWLAQLVDAGKEPGTIKLYLGRVSQLVAECGALETLTADQIRSWLDKHGGKPSTVNNRITSLNSFYRFAVKAGARKDNPMTGIKGVTRKEWGTPIADIAERGVEDLEGALARLDDLDAKCDRPVGESRAIAVVLVETGLLLSEALKLKVDTPASATVVLAKRSGDRPIALTPQAREAFDVLGGEITIGARAVGRRLEKAGITAKQLRYTKVKRMVEAGASRGEIRETLRTAPPKETCDRGHPLTGDNIYFNAMTGHRQCRACKPLLSQQHIERAAEVECITEGCNRGGYIGGICRRCYERTRAKRTARTRRRRRRMERILMLRAQGTGIGEACAAAGIAASTYRSWRERYPWFAAELNLLDGDVTELSVEGLVLLQEKDQRRDEYGKGWMPTSWDMSLDRPVGEDAETCLGDLVSVGESVEEIVLRRMDAERDAYLSDLLELFERQQEAIAQGLDPRRAAAESLGISLDLVLKMEADVEAFRREAVAA